MTITPENFTRALSDATRLRLLMLLQGHNELCVCELTKALVLPQPKISRHLAILRETGLLRDRRSGLWIHYRLNPELPAWTRDSLDAIARGCEEAAPFEQDRERLRELGAGALASCG